MDISEVREDLFAEQQALDALVAGLSPAQWQLPTPSPRWNIADQIAHLTYFDGTAALAIEDPDGFAENASELVALLGSDDPVATDDAMLGRYRALSREGLLAQWRANRAALATAAMTLDNDSRVAWYGPSMGSKSFLTARLMEVWAHGQDIADTVGATREATNRLRHIAQLGFITRGWTYANRGVEVPSAPVRVALDLLGDTALVFGPEDAVESVVGSAEDFCLVTTQRRHVDDTDLTVTGRAARDWMEKAQLFAGPASDGPAANLTRGSS